MKSSEGELLLVDEMLTLKAEKCPSDIAGGPGVTGV
jgi:hypothetical protein